MNAEYCTLHQLSTPGYVYVTWPGIEGGTLAWKSEDGNTSFAGYDGLYFTEDEFLPTSIEEAEEMARQHAGCFQD